MDFFNTILLSVICIMFPLLLYLIYLTYLNAKNENLKYEEVVFELALITGLFLTIELTKGVRTNYSIVLLNIPILFSYLRGKRGIGIILSIILGIYYITSFKYNAYMVIFEYLVYYIFFLIESNKNTTTLRNISWFTIIKTFFFSFFIYYFNPNITFMDAFNNIFVAILVFYVCSILCYKLLSKSEDVINLNNSLKELEKEKNLLKLKNEYHDIIGYRLALFDKYLEQENKDINNILKLLDSIYEDFNSKLDSNEKLKNLINMYSIIGINVKVFGALPIDEGKGIVFFEIIREAITNAIIHANSKNIKVVITARDNYIEMVITNDGNKPKSVIFENEGIKGMRKKLSNINGSLKVITDDNFKLIIKA